MTFILQKILILVFFSASLFFTGYAMAECEAKDDDSHQSFCENETLKKACEELDPCQWNDD